MRWLPFLVSSTFITFPASAFMAHPPAKKTAAIVAKYFKNLKGTPFQAKPHHGPATRDETATILASATIFGVGQVIWSSPLLTNSLACMWLSSLGDILAQKFEQFEKVASKQPGQATKMDTRRAARLAAFGFMVSGPLYSSWYPLLDSLCSPWSLAKYGVWATPIVKMVLELLLIEPIFLCSFFGFMNFAKGGTMQTFLQKIHSEFIPTYKMSLTIWPPIMLLSFRFVPVAALPMVVNAANALWDAYLSYKNSQSCDPVRDEGGEFQHVEVAPMRELAYGVSY